MKNNFKFLTLAAFAAATVLSSCNKSDGDNGVFEGDLPSVISSDFHLTAGEYWLNGACHVTNGSKLTIDPGVTIKAYCDELFDYILIEQGSTIYAVGEANNPIVMTSESAADGWGGLHLCGKATINGSSTTAESEIGESIYGGSSDNDNSGTLKYVRVENSGKTISSEKEANGFSFYGVGSGTSVSYCQAYGGSDDGFEFFGGTAEISNCVVIDCTDDSFDWTQGWRGKATNIIAIQTTGSDCDCLMECDNSGSDNSRVPVSRPTITNATLIGDGDGKGIRLREGTQIELDNVIVYNAATPLVVESQLTHASLTNDWSNTEVAALVADWGATYKEESILKNIALDGAMTSTASVTTDDGDTYTVDASYQYTSSNFTSGTNNTESASFTNTTSYKVATTDVSGAFDTATDWTAGEWCTMPTSL
ncbi:MAG: hypothetical protein R3Y68_00960 [Rikenellaceae bacterium]